MTRSLSVRAAALLAFAACTSRSAEAPMSPPSYLYLWTASADSTQPDFLAALDVTEDSMRYGRLVTTVAVPGVANGPHHSEHEMPADQQLFVNGFATGQSWIFDLKDPQRPRIAGQFGDLAGYSHPHSFLRLPNGNVLATFQMRHEAGRMLPGGLVEVTSAGEVVRSVSANGPGVHPKLRVYSAGIIPSLDRIVTTTTDMGRDATAPSARLVSSFPRKAGTSCAIPVIVGHYYLVTVPAVSAVVSLDISDPAAPTEVSRVTLGTNDVPHWISITPDKRRVVVTGYQGMQHRVVIARFDSTTGQLTVDQRFREEGASEPGFRMDNKTWPHGGNAKGIPHGAVFSRP